MKNRIIAAGAAVLLAAGGLAIAAPAAATEAPCVPVAAWDETVVITPAIAEVPAVPEVLEVSHTEYQRYSWVGGPIEAAPEDVPPGDNWQANTTNYEGAGHGTDPIGEPFQMDNPGQGNADWFFWTAELVIDTPYQAGIPAIPGVPAVTSIVHHDAVTCPPVDEEPEPETYTPSCTTVTGSQTIVGDGRIEVDGEWDTTSIAVPFSGTLADIGTVLDIQATPLQYVGLHIRTAEGSISFEEEASYGGNLWSNATWEGVSAGMGYAAFGSITDYIEFNGDVVVTGIDLLYTHPEASATVVESFTIGCTVYTFEPEVVEPPVEPPVVTPPAPPAPPAPAAPAAVVPATLAATGGPDMTLLGLVAAAIMALGAAATIATRVRRSHV